MKTKTKSQHRKIYVAKLPKRPLVRRLEQAEDPVMTHEENRLALQSVIEGIFVPILIGKVSIRDLITPAGGWGRLDAAHPNLMNLPISAQLVIALQG